MHALGVSVADAAVWWVGAVVERGFGDLGIGMEGIVEGVGSGG